MAVDETGRMSRDELNHMGIVGLGAIHQLATPLSASLLALDVLIHDLKNHPELEREAIIVRVESERVRLAEMGRLIHHFRKWVSHEVSELKTFELSQFVRETIHGLTPVFRQLGPNIPIVQGRALHICTDPIWLRQIISCLLLNALEATQHRGDKGRVEVEWTMAQGTVELTVSDNGGATVVPAIELGETTKATGMGVGLTLTARLLKELGGQLTIRKTHDGDGLAAQASFPNRSAGLSCSGDALG